MIKHHLRSLRRARGFSFLVVLTMSLGIGTATALFSVVDAVLLQPLAFADAGRVVTVHTFWPAKNRATPRLTGGDFVDLRSGLHSFSALSLYTGGNLGVRVGDHASFAWTFLADPTFFRVLAVAPTLGRLPGVKDADQTAVLTTSFARANWGNPANALGQSVVVENKPYQVIGLVDDRFAFPEKAELWITGPVVPENRNHSAFNYYAIGRLRPGIDMKRAQAELSTMAVRLAHANPDADEGKTFQILSLQENMTGSIRTTLLFLFGASGLLLLISCANVANLMLGRAAVRSRDIAVRMSLGLRSLHIVQMLVLEGALLGSAAAVLGLLLAYLFVRALLPFIPATVPRAASILQMHPSVLLFASAMSCLTAILCSLVPALHLRRFDIAEVLKKAPGRGFAASGARSRHITVIAQIALCCILCLGALLLSRSLLALVRTPLGYNSEGILVMYADAPALRMQEYLQAIRTFETALAGIQQIPGVRSAAAVMGLPTGRYGSSGSYLVEGVHIQPGQDPFKTTWSRDLPEAVFSLASPHYFQSIGIRLLAGRDFTLHDQYDAPFAAIISQSLARQSFGSSNPLGRRIYCGLDSPKPMTIVGIVSDVRQNSPASRLEPEIYMPFEQHPAFANEMQLVVAANRDPKALIPEVRRRMHRIAPLTAISFTTFPDMVRDSISVPRFRAALALAFALLAVLLGMTGVYSVMAYSVSERKAELGLRMALGADKVSIAVFVLRRAVFLAIIGLAIGITCAAAMNRAVDSLLYGLHALDLPTYCIGAGLVFLVMLAAASFPSWRATRIEPVEALRSE